MPHMIAKPIIPRIIVAQDGSGHTGDIQTGINLLPATGGEVYIKEGTYTITTALSIPNSNISICGGGKATRIDTTSNIAMITTTSKDDLLIRDLYLYGAGAGNGSNDGIYFLGTCRRCKIINCWIENTGNEGIRLSTSSHTIIENCWIDSVKASAIHITSSNDDIIINNSIYSPSISGITISPAGIGSEIKNNIISFCGLHGINIITVRAIVTNNTCASNGGWGINMGALSDYNILTGNICRLNVTGQINITGTNSISFNNIEE